MDGRIEDALREAGIEPPRGGDLGAGEEALRVAHTLHARGVRSVGLLGATAGLPVPAVALQLGQALAETAGGAGVVDGRRTWLRLAPGAEGEPDVPGYATGRIGGRLLLLSPVAVEKGAALRALASLVRRGEPRALAVDLTGFLGPGEHLEAIALLDAVAVVARAGRTTLRQVERRMRDVPAGRCLGVVLATD